MAYNAQKVTQIYDMLRKMGHKEEFCNVISRQMCTDWTSMRMIGYLRQSKYLSEEDIVDEMLAILSDRDRIIKKKEMEYYQGKINDLYNNGFDETE